jgi:hypothetical protein
VVNVYVFILREGQGNREVEKTIYQGALCSVLLTKYFSVINSSMRCPGHVTRIGEVHTGFWWVNPTDEDPGLNWGGGGVILKWVFKKA